MPYQLIVIIGHSFEDMNRLLMSKYGLKFSDREVINNVVFEDSMSSTKEKKHIIGFCTAVLTRYKYESIMLRCHMIYYCHRDKYYNSIDVNIVTSDMTSFLPAKLSTYHSYHNTHLSGINVNTYMYTPDNITLLKDSLLEFEEQQKNQASYTLYINKIMIIQNDKICFAYKHFDTQTNKIVYMTENNEIVNVDIEQYKRKDTI